MSRTAAEALVDQLVIQGVRHVFCVPGESYLPVLDALVGREIELTVCRQEGGAAIMAEAVGKATGRPGVCFVTRGPGATNAAHGVHIARQSSSADDPVRRPGGPRRAGPRRLAGARLRRRVRLDGQVGGRDRRRRPRARDGLARLPRGDERPAGPGGAGAAARHAGRDDRRGRRARSPSRPSRRRARRRWRRLRGAAGRGRIAVRACWAAAAGTRRRARR